MYVRLLTLALFSWSCSGDKDDSAGGADGDADTDTDSDTDADTDTDSDTDSDTDLFFDAKGTYDGEAFEVNCPPDFLLTQRRDVEGFSFVVAVCSTVDAQAFGVLVAAIDPKVDELTDCSFGVSIIEVAHFVDGDKESTYSCTDGGVSDYEMDLTQVDENESSTTWGGTFSMVGDDGTHAAEASGSFRVESVDVD